MRRIDPSFNAVDKTMNVRGLAGFEGGTSGAVAVGEGGVWVVSGGVGQVVRIDPDSTKVVATIDVGVLPTGVAVGGGAVWVTDVYGNAVTRIDPETNVVAATIPVGLNRSHHLDARKLKQPIPAPEVFAYRPYRTADTNRPEQSRRERDQSTAA